MLLLNIWKLIWTSKLNLKFLLLFIIFFVFNLFGFLFLINYTRELRSSVHEIHEKHFLVAKHVQLMHQNLLSWNRAILNFVMARNLDETDKFHRSIILTKDKIMNDFITLSESGPVSKEIDILLNNWKKNFDEAFFSQKKIFHYKNEQKFNKAKNILHNEFRPLIDRAGRISLSISNLQQGKLEDLIQRSDKIYNNVQQILILYSVILFSFGLIITILISRILSQSMDKTAQAISKKNKAEEKVIKLSSRLIQSQENERQKLAKDLHDSVGQTIVAAKLSLLTYKKNPRKHREQLNVAINFMDKSSHELREIYTGLFPSILEDFGLAETIRWYSRYYLRYHGIETDLHIELNKKLSPDLEVNLYRITQELFSNIVKYSQASKVFLDLKTTKENKLFMRVKDNGVGFQYNVNSQKMKGFGLLNIEKRVDDLNGKISIDSQKKNGTVIEILVPT